MLCFFFNDTATTEIYTLSLHDALPISTAKALTLNQVTLIPQARAAISSSRRAFQASPTRERSGEHTSEHQSTCNIVCRHLAALMLSLPNLIAGSASLPIKHTFATRNPR